MKLFKINFLILFFISSFLTIANAGTGAATVYKIQIYKIELCDSTSTTSVCNGATTIYSSTAGSGDIDIASTTAGEAAASLGNLNKATIGTSYTYMQITMNRAFTVSGSAADGSGTTCYTNANGSATTSAKGHTSTASEVTLYAAIVGATGENRLNSITTLDDTTYTAGTVVSGDEYFQWRNVLASTLIITGGRIPAAKIAFGTTNAVGAADDMGDSCTTVGSAKGLYAASPDVTISFE